MRTTARTRKRKTPPKPTQKINSRTARNIELYNSAYQIVWKRISPVQKREQPDLVLWLHASIRRQLKHGAKDPYSIAFEALKALAERGERVERQSPERGNDWPTNAATAK